MGVVTRAAQIDAGNRSTLTLRRLTDRRARGRSKTIDWRARETIDGGAPLQLPRGAHQCLAGPRQRRQRRLGAGILISRVVVGDG